MGFRQRGLVLALGALCAATASAQLLWEEPFDDGQIHLPWFTTTSGVASWSLAESPGLLTVNQLQGAVVNQWCEVVLTRSLGCLDDFLVTVDLGWTEVGNSAMQGLFVEVGGPDGPIAMGGFDDAWVAARGQWTSHVDEQVWGIGYDTMPLYGTTEVKLIRVDGQCQVRMNNLILNNGPQGDPATWLKLRHRRFQYPGSAFGTLWTDRVRVEAPFRIDLEPLADGSLRFSWIACDPAPKRLYGAPTWPALWPVDFQLVAEVPAGATEWILPAPLGDSLSVFRATRLLE